MPGHSYKGRANRPYLNVGLQAASAFDGGGAILEFVFTYTNPARWSGDRLTAGQWVRVVTVTGAARAISGFFSHGDTVSVIGVDANLNPITARSNAVHLA